MSTNNTRKGAAGGGADDTAELPAVKLDRTRDIAGGLDGTDSWASTDSWKLVTVLLSRTLLSLVAVPPRM